MTYNPLKDKKFITGAIDLLVFLVLYFAGKYAPVSLYDDLKTVFAAVQPLVLLWVAGQFQVEGAFIRQGVMPDHFKG
jgi:hypothetical protein